MQNKKRKFTAPLIAAAAIAVVVILLVVAVTAGLFTQDVLDKKVNAATHKQDMEKVIAVLPPQDLQALAAGILLCRYNGEDMETMTYRGLIEKGRERQKKFEESVAKEMQDFFRRDSLERDSLHRDSLLKAKE